MAIHSVLSHIDENLPKSLDRLFDFLKIASISTDPAYAQHCQAAADWLVADLQSIGIEAKAHPTAGHPIVTGQIDGPGPHLLFYGHYDVQPVDPVELWRGDPFNPEFEDTAAGRIIRARGASDDKGQLMTFVEACRAWQKVNGSLPCKITFFFEGEEESGSPSLAPFLKDHASALGADLALVCDTSMVAPGVPSIVSQLRGVVDEEFTLQGGLVDLHSGDYGGPGLNPLKEISRIIATFHDTTGRVAVDGFYDGVEEVSDAQRAQWDTCGFDEETYLKSAGFSMPHGEKGYSTLTQQWARPTLEINGLWGGYQGAGTKTVIPAQAHCKLTCRLVGQMDPDKVRRKIRAHVEALLPADARVIWSVDADGGPAATMDTSRPEFAKAASALRDEWGRDTVFVGSGGSIPIVGLFSDILDLESMLIGFAHDDDAIHSPNEKYNVESFHKGIRSWARILAQLSH